MIKEEEEEEKKSKKRIVRERLSEGQSRQSKLQLGESPIKIMVGENLSKIQIK